MRQESTHAALAGDLGGIAKAGDGFYCKYCGSKQIFRVFRRGYLQETIYPLFGFYPWKCKVCHRSMLLRKRKWLRSQGKSYGG